jgi:hypothetical protein
MARVAARHVVHLFVGVVACEALQPPAALGETAAQGQPVGLRGQAEMPGELLPVGEDRDMLLQRLPRPPALHVIGSQVHPFALGRVADVALHAHLDAPIGRQAGRVHDGGASPVRVDGVALAGRPGLHVPVPRPMASLAVDAVGQRLQEAVGEAIVGLHPAVVAGQARVVDAAEKARIGHFVARTEVPAIRLGIPAHRHLIQPPFVRGDERSAVVARTQHVREGPFVHVGFPAVAAYPELFHVKSAAALAHRVAQSLMRDVQDIGEARQSMSGVRRDQVEGAPHAGAREPRGNLPVAGGASFRTDISGRRRPNGNGGRSGLFRRRVGSARRQKQSSSQRTPANGSAHAVAGGSGAWPAGAGPRGDAGRAAGPASPRPVAFLAAAPMRPRSHTDRSSIPA